MHRLRQTTLDHVLAAWLQAEIASPQFGHHLLLADPDRRIVEHPDLNDPAEKSLRRSLLRYRDDILTTLPEDTEWWEAALSARDLTRLLAINDPAWEIYSGGTGSLASVAASLHRDVRPEARDPKIAEGLVAIRENVVGIYRALRQGGTVGPLVLLGRNAAGPFTVIEGNKRAAALCWHHCLDAAPASDIAALAGITPRPNPWLSRFARSPEGSA